MQRQEEQIREASESAARAELLLQEEAGFLEAEGVEKTYNYRQDQLSKEVDINTSKKVNKGHRCMYGWIKSFLTNGMYYRYLRSISPIMALIALITQGMDGRFTDKVGKEQYADMGL